MSDTYSNIHNSFLKQPDLENAIKDKASTDRVVI